MADNVQLPGTGQVVATKEIGGVEYQVMLLADGTYTIISPATAANQTLLLTELQKKADLTETQPVSMATIPTGAATAAKQLADGHNVAVSNQITGYATSAKQLADGHNVAVSNMIPAVETGLATSAKQLADGHNVAVSNMIPAVETGLATSAKQLPDGHEVKLPSSQIVTLTPPAAITGYATSAKQLADNHQVQVSNIANTPLITGFATSAKQLAAGHTVTALWGFSLPLYDSIYQTIDGVTKVFVYKLTASTVATITVTYTDDSFMTLVSAIKT